MQTSLIGIFVFGLALGLVLSQFMSPRVLTKGGSCSEADAREEVVTLEEWGYHRLGPEFGFEPWWEQFDSDRTLYVAPYTQLGNTLQCIASAMTVAYSQRLNVKFVFNQEWFGLARWDELFSFPMLNASQTFPDGERNIYKTDTCSSMNAVRQWNPADVEWKADPRDGKEMGCVMPCCWRQPSWPRDTLWFYKILRPTRSLKRIVDEFKRSHDWTSYQWVGVHVSRTDNIVTMQRLMKFHTIEKLRKRLNLTSEDALLPLQQYVDLMIKIQNLWPIETERVKPVRFYLASDRESSKRRILELFPDKEAVVTFDWERITPAVPEHDPVTWKTQFAVVELFLLGSCRIIIDTPFSTYSEAASYIGNGLLLEPNFAYGQE